MAETGTLPLAALYAAPTRLLVALVVFVLFVAVAPRPSPRPLAFALTGAIAAGWLFGATLIWGTGYPSKLRWGLHLDRWQGTALLALAVLGVLASAGALRWFAQQRQRHAWSATIVFAVAYGGWSSVVRYSALVALLALAIGLGALVFASRPPSPSTTAASKQASKSTASGRLWRIPANAMPLLSGFLFYWWLKWSPKTVFDPQCGLPGWLPLTFIPFIAIPGLTAAIKTRTLGRRGEATAAAVLVAVTVTVGVCVIAFLAWFGANRCGE